MEHFMLDLETLGTRPNAPIIAIGAVEFDLEHGKLGQEFYEVINFESAVKAGGVIDPRTVQWWMQQSDKARDAFSRPGVHIDVALERLYAWMQGCCFASGNRKVWGNGASFDNVILSEAYKRSEKEVPWPFWNERCYRTVKNMFPAFKMMTTGTAHNALDDARNQARHLVEIYEAQPKL